MSRHFPILLFLVALVAGTLWQATDASAMALKCSRIIKQSGREHLINTCDSCRIVGISRRRPGADAPISRTVTIPSKSNVTLSFRGPGQSRITSDAPCEAETGGQAGAPNTVQGDNAKCITLSRSANGLSLANACGQCRMTVIERLDGKGGKKLQNIAIDGRKAVGLPSKGASYARILMEKNCK